MKRNTTARKGFTLVELLVVIGIIALLISILLPTLSRARDSARAIKCGSNVRSIAQGLIGYSTDFEGNLPYGYIDFGFGDAGDGTPASQQAMQEWTHTVSGYLNTERSNGYNLPWTTQAVWYTDPNDNYHPVLYCPSVGDEFADQQSHYNTNMTIMPHVFWETYAGTPVQRGSHSPSNLAQTYADNALLWDGVQHVFVEDPMTRTVGISYYPSPALTGVDGGNLAFGVITEGETPGRPDLELLFRSDAGESVTNLGDPNRSVEYPAFINPPSFAEAVGDPAMQANQDLLLPGSSFYVELAGAPIFRHNANERAQTAFVDGSVRGLRWNPKDEHEAGFWVTSEFTRNMLRPKFPNPAPKFAN